MAKAAGSLLEESSGTGREGLVQLEAATQDGSVFVVRDDDRFVAAVTGPQPTVGLIFYDLKTCLRQVAEEAASKAETTKASKEKKEEEPTQESTKGGPAKTSSRTTTKRATRKAAAGKKDEADNGS